MADPVNIGLDFGSLGFRVAYVVEEEMVSLPCGGGWDDPARWLMSERSPATVLGIHFPGVKSLIGALSAASDKSVEQATETVLKALIELRGLAAEHAGRPASQLVISVPALYSASRRAALRDLALSAGFTDVHLLNDSMAAVIGHAYQSEEPITALVYNLGYSGFEVGLIRYAKGRYWAIGYDGASSPGGEAFDTIVMRGCLQALSKQHLWSPSSDLPPEEWFKLRSFAERLKEKLSESETADLSLGVAGAAQEVLPLSLSREEFEAAITEPVKMSLDKAERLLDDANLTVGDVNEVLLLGGSAHIGLVQRLIAERFSQQPVIPSTNLLAQGAAVYAARLGQLPTTETAVVRDEQPLNAETPLAAIPVLRITLSSEGAEDSDDDHARQDTRLRSVGRTSKPEVVLSITQPAINREERAEAPVNSMTAILSDRERLFHYARQLIDKGSYDRARGFLEGLAQDAQTMLATIPFRPTPIMKREVEQALRRSGELLQTGRFQQAIELSHHAYAIDPENPQVFEQMIEIHCRAAMAHTSVEGYKKSMEWLMCAHSHDRTNAVIHDRIAERHFIHAQQLGEQSRYAEALKVLEECQYFNPEHEGAMALAAEILQRQDR